MATINAITIMDSKFYTKTELEAIKKITLLKKKIKDCFVEREEVIDGLWDAIICQKHVVLVGSPGTAKSALLKAFTSCFKGARYFAWQVMTSTKPEEIFGHLSLKGLKEDKYERITTGKLPDCEIGNLDELFNCNSGLLNGLNEPLNERIFEGKQIKLQIMVGGTNFIPEDPVLVAFFDRLMYRFIVEEIQVSANFLKMLSMSEFNITDEEKIDMSTLKLLQDKSKTVSIERVLPILGQLRDVLKVNGFNPSSRRFKWCITALQARAVVEGRAEVDLTDLFVLKNVLWEKKDDINKIETIINKVIDPVLENLKSIVLQAQSIDETIAPLYPKKPEDSQKIFESVNKLKKLLDEITIIKNRADLSPRIKNIAEMMFGQVEQIRNKIWNTKF